VKSFLLAGLLIGSTLSQTALADGLIYALPADGAQARYDMQITIVGQDVKIGGSVTVSSVGQVTVDNEKCRWIEIKMITKDGDQEQIGLSKVLIAEKHLGKDKSAGPNMIRAWIKEGDMAPMEVKDFSDPKTLALVAFLTGPGQNAATLDALEIENAKLGKLSCPGVTGQQEIDGPNGLTIGIQAENRLHEKAPFGLVSADWKFDLKANGQVAASGSFKLTLTDISTTALSELPDRN
jgi:hypothetical protein